MAPFEICKDNLKFVLVTSEVYVQLKMKAFTFNFLTGQAIVNFVKSLININL